MKKSRKKEEFPETGEEVQIKLADFKTKKEEIDYLNYLLAHRESLSNIVLVYVASKLEELYLYQMKHKEASEMWESLKDFTRARQLLEHVAAMAEDYEIYEKKIAELKRKELVQSPTQRIKISAGIISLLAGLFLLYPNLTGNTIANLSQTTTSSLSFLCFIAGIVTLLLALVKR